MKEIKPVYSTNRVTEINILEQNKTINEKIKEDKQHNKHKSNKGYYAYFN